MPSSRRFILSFVSFLRQIVSDIFFFCSLLMCRKEATLWRWTAILLLRDRCKDFQSQHQEDFQTQHQEDFQSQHQEDFLRNVTKISLEVVISSLQYHFHTCCKYSWSPSEPTAVLRFKKTSMSFHFALDLHQEAICRSFLKRPTESMPSIYLTLLNMDINNFETGNRI